MHNSEAGRLLLMEAGRQIIGMLKAGKFFAFSKKLVGTPRKQPSRQ